MTTHTNPKWRQIQFFMCPVVIAAAIFAAIWSIRTWIADADVTWTLTKGATSPTADANYRLNQALRMRPDLDTAYRLLADRMSQEDSVAALKLAKAATTVNPYSGEDWTSLALIYLQRDQPGQTETALRRARQLDRGYAAHFQLASLLLIEGDTAGFFQEIKSSLSAAPSGAVTSILREIASVAPGQPQLETSLLPKDRPDVMIAAIYFFLQQKETTAALAAWKTFSCPSYRSTDCKQVALAIIRRLAMTDYDSLPTNHPSSTPSAITLWNQSVRQGLLDGPLVQTGSCTDCGFDHEWHGPAFGWQDTGPLHPQVVASNKLPASNIVSIDFPGDEPESFTLLQQLIPVAPGETYAISYSLRSDHAAPNDQGAISANILTSPGHLIMTVPASLQTTWTGSSGQFTVPATVSQIMLAFVYRRPFGSTLLTGNVEIGNVSFHRKQGQ